MNYFMGYKAMVEMEQIIEIELKIQTTMDWV